MELTTLHYTGMAVALATVFGLGVYSARMVHSSQDFSITGRRSGAILVAGTILGTLVGGASTIGTAQLAFMYGFSAWWFTLGSGIGCLLIAVFLVKPVRKTSFETLPQLFASNYGTAAGVASAFFISLGMFANVVPQIFSSLALLHSWMPLDWRYAAAGAAVLMGVYVLFGGLWGAGLMGVSKVILTLISLLAAGVLSYTLMGGFPGMLSSFSFHPWFNLLGRGVNEDLAAAFSMLLGVFSSQVYFQAIFASRDTAAARRGSFISAAVGPLIGMGGILVGMFMRLEHPHIIPSQAMPLFIMNYLPPWFGGIAFATLLLATVGTGAGLSLGISTTLSRDIFQRCFPRVKDKTMLLVFRLMVVLVLVAALLTVYYTGKDAVILNWSYFSLGMRGASVCFPLLAVVFLKNRIPVKSGVWALVLPPLIVMTGLALPFPVNPLYPGLLAGVGILLGGYLLRSKSLRKTKQEKW